MPVSELLTRWSARELSELGIYLRLQADEVEQPKKPQQQTPQEMINVLRMHSPKKAHA